ncbi:MAG: AbrB/MazE/SpoVT family DNA-binding domain-containing protein [Candidatus Hydrothermarchaeota archaeon]|nr:AbrB/MazE/SpoVT family DNA-binding domain-containing protein [Candidatus Hydrothermarchaeota archaeon]
MKTKISKGYQVVVPAEVREKFELEPGDMLLWEKKNDEVVVKPKKRARLEDIMGIISVKANAVELKKKAQRGEL